MSAFPPFKIEMSKSKTSKDSLDAGASIASRISSFSPSQLDDNFTEIYRVPNKSYKTEQDILTLRNYKLSKQVGHGGYGIVYKADRTDDNKVVAIKMVDLNKKSYERMVKHFKTELYVMARCKHVNIIEVLDHFIINSKAYIVMEFADGGTLSQIAKNPLSETVSQKFFLQILKGLCHLHRNNIAHRDLKLDNVLLVTQGTATIVKVTDFGLSSACYKPHKGFIESGTFAGTRLYMAPEIIRTRVYKNFRKEFCLEFDPFKADIWALGICLYEMLTTKVPYESYWDDDLLKLQESRQYSFPKNCTLSLLCKDIMWRMLDPNVDSRIDPFGICTHSWIATSLQDS